MDPVTTFHLMRKMGAVTDERYSEHDHQWVIDQFDMCLGSFTLTHGEAEVEAWIFDKLLPLIKASERAASYL